MWQATVSVERGGAAARLIAARAEQSRNMAKADLAPRPRGSELA